jgi:hypothetical protein
LAQDGHSDFSEVVGFLQWQFAPGKITPVDEENGQSLVTAYFLARQFPGNFIR